MNYESLKNVFGDEGAKMIVAMLKQKEAMDWPTKQAITLAEGYPVDTSTHQFFQADNLNTIGWEHHTDQQYEDALDCYRQALELCPEFPMVWNNKGLAHFRLQQFDEAKQAYERAIAINPLFIKPYSNLGILFYELRRDCDQARAWLLRALALDPKYQRAREYLAKVDADSGPSDFLMIGTDPDFAAGLVEEFKKHGKTTKWIG